MLYVESKLGLYVGISYILSRASGGGGGLFTVSVSETLLRHVSETEIVSWFYGGSGAVF